MSKIDLKDRRILYELDLDARESLTKIGKKVGLKKDVVSYRLKQLEEKGVIRNYYTDIDTFRLGYNVFRIYINFQYVSEEIKKEIINYFVNYPKSWVIGTVKSEIDFNAVIWVQNIFEFYQFWDKTLDKYEDYFAEYTLSIYIKADVFKKSYLLPEKQDEEGRKLFEIHCGGTPATIDELDYKLLNELADNARAPLIELAEKLGCSSQSVNYRIKNLVKSGVIKAFRVEIDLTKLDLQRFKVDLYLKDHKMKKPICDFLNKKPYLEYMNYGIGWADLGPEFVVEDFEGLYSILDGIKQKFPNAIKKQSFFIVEKIHKLRCMPEL